MKNNQAHLLLHTENDEKLYQEIPAPYKANLESGVVKLDKRAALNIRNKELPNEVCKLQEIQSNSNFEKKEVKLPKYITKDPRNRGSPLRILLRDHPDRR